MCTDRHPYVTTTKVVICVYDIDEGGESIGWLSLRMTMVQNSIHFVGIYSENKVAVPLVLCMGGPMGGLGFGDGYATQGGDIGSNVARILWAKYDTVKRRGPDIEFTEAEKLWSNTWSGS
ncbi:hypothetical protein K439DRAFT_1514860 [Ramaria rubella]|nr:hypothetical protein K439DRAFT_1514860 [Ramaria rubella]